MAKNWKDLFDGKKEVYFMEFTKDCRYGKKGDMMTHNSSSPNFLVLTEGGMTTIPCRFLCKVHIDRFKTEKELIKFLRKRRVEKYG